MLISLVLCLPHKCEPGFTPYDVNQMCAMNFGLSSHPNIKNSSVVGKEFDIACSGEERAFPLTTAPKKSGGDGGFTCCVPGCFSNNKKNPELSFYNFRNGKSPESQELRKKWIHLISRKNFTPTLARPQSLLTTFPRRQKNTHELSTDHSTQNN